MNPVQTIDSAAFVAWRAGSFCFKGLMAGCHSYCLIFIFVYIHWFIFKNTFVHLHIAVEPSGKTSQGCRAEIWSRTCLSAASQLTTKWATRLHRTLFGLGRPLLSTHLRHTRVWVPSRDLISKLPFSKLTHYQMSYAASFLLSLYAAPFLLHPSDITPNKFLKNNNERRHWGLLLYFQKYVLGSHSNWSFKTTVSLTGNYCSVNSTGYAIFKQAKKVSKML